jgi:dUTP pyrophosphatase
MPTVKVVKVHPSLPDPKYETEQSATVDLYTTDEVVIRAGEYALVPTNFRVECPKGYVALLVMRSSTFKKFGIIMPNGAGIIDRDYCGPDDVVTVPVLNMRHNSIVINAGERIAQLLFVKSEQLQITIVDDIDRPNRGGFGSTS